MISPHLINLVWIAVLFSTTITAILIADALKHNGWWVSDKPASESDIFRVVHHILYDFKDSIEDNISEVLKRLKTEGFHNAIEIKSEIKKNKEEIIRILDEALKQIEDEEAD